MTTKQILLKDKGKACIGEFVSALINPSVFIIKFDSAQNISWSKKITPDAQYGSLNLYGLEEAGNGNIAVSGFLSDLAGNKHFYRLILSPAGSTILQDIVSTPFISSSNKGVHAICKLSSDSLLFLFNADISTPVYILSSSNNGNIGSSVILRITSPEHDISFAQAKVVGQKLRLYGSGYAIGCDNLNWSGTFTSLQYDLLNKQVDYLKTYCVPYTSYASDNLPPYVWNSINHLPFRMFFLSSGKVAMVRPYKGYSPTVANTAIPMFISYFDSSFNLLRSEFLYSGRWFKTLTIQDLYIDKNETKHFSFADFNAKQVYYAVADSANKFLLQKKMPIPNFGNNGNSLGMQVLQQEMFTGFTVNRIAYNRSYIDYVQIRTADTAAACFGIDTSFLSFIPFSINQTSPGIVTTTFAATAASTPLLFPAADHLMIRKDICIIKTICDTIKISAPDIVCNTSQPVIITVHKNPLCNGKVNFTFDTTAVQSFVQTNDTTLSLTFNKSWTGKIFARPSTCDKLIDSVEIIVNTPLAQIDLGNDTIYCPGKTYLLNAYNPGFKKYQWHDGRSDSVYLASSPGIYSVTATDFCNRLYTDTIRVVKKEFNINLGKDSTICKSESMTLTIKAGYYSYNWFPQYALTPDAPNRVTVSPETSTAYTIEAEVLQGCKLSDTVNINVENCPQYIYFPTGFTPNNDGLNDNFRPSSGGALIKYELQIFNRWGQLVFQTAIKTVGWDGKLKGLLQSSGTFVWQCKYQFYGKPEKMIKGTFMLIR